MASGASKLSADIWRKSSRVAPLSMRSGQARPTAIGTRMSGVPSCAMTEASVNCTIECTTLCG
jgi:hypothetical protein